MAIDVKTLPPLDGPPSQVGAGWWMDRLAKDLRDPFRLRRLSDLDDWYRGEPPLPNVAANARLALRAFHENSSSNFSALIVDAVRERQRVRGIRTSSDRDSTGDAEAWDLWMRMRMPMVTADALRFKGRFGRSFILVDGPPEDEPNTPVATAEDPRHVVAECDPMRPWLPRAGLKMWRDSALGWDLAYLYRPGRVDVAGREISRNRQAGTVSRFSADGWEWLPELEPVVPDGLMPLIPFENLDGVGEFEPHLRLLRRIDFMILQRMTIAVLQAFKQRAVKGVPNVDQNGKEIDYNDILSADPGAVWLLPATAELWESGQVDLSGVISAATEDIKKLSTVSRTPFPTMIPGGQNQSADGAAYSREGLVFKVEDRNARDETGLQLTMSAGYQWLGKEMPPSAISMIWAPPQRSSLSERANAVAQAAAGGVPFRTRMIQYGEHDPGEVDQMETERAEDALLAQVAAAQAQTLPQARQDPDRAPAPQVAATAQAEAV